MQKCGPLTSINEAVCTKPGTAGLDPSRTRRLSYGRGEFCSSAGTPDIYYMGSVDAEAARKAFVERTAEGGSEYRPALPWACRNGQRGIDGDKMSEAQQMPTDEHLVKATLSGDDEAFAGLVRRYKQKVLRLAARLLNDRDELDDICQEAFIKAYQSLNKFRGEAPFEHWMTKIAVNVCYDMLRKQSRRRHEVSLDSVAFSLGNRSSAENPSGEEAWGVLRSAMSKLRPEERLVITLLNLEEKSVRETALLTGWSEANVKVRAFRARKELKRIMEGDHGK